MNFTVDNELLIKYQNVATYQTSALSSITNTLTSTPWDDQIYYANYGDQAKTYLSKRADVESVSKLGMIFIAEYLGLARLSSDQVASLYKAVWPMMIIDKRYVFSHVGLSNCATFTEATYDVGTYRFPGAKANLVVKNTKYTKINVRQFWEVVGTKLAGTATDKQDIINLAGFIMLNCMRLIKKESTM